MTGKGSTKFEIPKVWQSPDSITELIAEAVPSDENALLNRDEPVVPETTPASEQRLAGQGSSSRAVKRSKKSENRRLQIDVHFEVAKAAKHRAIEDSTSLSAIVEMALRAFLKT